MVINFKKNIVVGVSVTPEMGLEVAQVDYANRKVLKYACRQLAYDNIRKEIADLDIFKETLQEVFAELQLEKGTEIVLAIPPAVFKVTDYPASLTEEQVNNVIEEELLEYNLFKENDPGFSAIKLNNSTIQFSKIATAAVSKVMLIEIAMQIKELGYTLLAIDSTVNTTLNSLIYNARINSAPDYSWVMLLIENTCCRIIPMLGKNYVEYFEEKISIGEVLGEEENLSTILGAISPLLKNLPSQCLYVVSKTNVISAKAVAEKLVYNGQIVHEEANFYAQEPFIELSEDLDPANARNVSLDVIGAAINQDFASVSATYFNLYNSSLGAVFLDEQPPVLTLGNFTYKMSLENMIKATIICAIPIVIIIIALFSLIAGAVNAKQQDLSQINSEITKIKSELDAHKNISTEIFDEGDEIRIGIVHNKKIFSYYQIVGTEIPKKLWLTSLKLGKNVVIEGQADNLESVYSFFRSIKDYEPQSPIKLQSLGLATSSKISSLSGSGEFDTDSILTSMNADFYNFVISDVPVAKKDSKSNSKNKGLAGALEPLPDNLE